jgi:hypothetical protein
MARINVLPADVIQAIRPAPLVDGATNGDNVLFDFGFVIHQQGVVRDAPQRTENRRQTTPQGTEPADAEGAQAARAARV